MTQRRLRTIIELWFTNSPLGICGDEDSGAMSSWMAFSALGIYPVCPGKAEYALTSPMFDEIELTVPGGKFIIRAEGAGDGLRYIKSARLNGRDYSRAFISHADLVAGGELVLEMSDRPNKAWGLEN
jgi:putative alpha-1,2-mannosidase